MAPPPNRRPGYSRRAQYGLFAGYVVAIVGILASIGLVALGRYDPAAFSALRGAASDLTAPVGAAGDTLRRGLGTIGEEAAAWWRAGSQNAALRREVEASRRRVAQARLLEAENRRLRALLALRDRAPRTVAATRVIGSTLTASRRLVILGAGTVDGVRVGMPVRSPEGVIGRIHDSGRFASRALLVSDSGSIVPVRLLRNGAAALAAGRGDGSMELRPVEAGASPFRRGDIAVTSGIGGIFPQGAPVAVVTGPSPGGALARPLADPARVDMVLIESGYAPPALLAPPASPSQ